MELVSKCPRNRCWAAGDASTHSIGALSVEKVLPNSVHIEGEVS